MNTQTEIVTISMFCCSFSVYLGLSVSIGIVDEVLRLQVAALATSFFVAGISVPTSWIVYLGLRKISTYLKK